MGKLSSFNFITLDGYYKGQNEDISWHKHGREEEESYAEEGAASDSILLFGRVTYQMMASYWPTPMALQNSPKVAEGMNRSEKIVFSNTLQKADWSGTKIVSSDIIKRMNELKSSSKKNMTLLGSGTILSQFADHNLIDEYQVLVDPVMIGSGTSIFKCVKRGPELRLTNSRTFKSGAILLCYEPIRK